MWGAILCVPAMLMHNFFMVILDMQMYEFARAAIANFHRLGGLEQQKLTLSQI